MHSISNNKSRRLLLILAFASTFLLQAVAAQTSNCQACMDIWDNIQQKRQSKADKNKKFKCKNYCKKLQRKGKFKNALKPFCKKNSCCVSLCQERSSALAACTQTNYCSASAAPSASTVTSPVPSAGPSESPSRSPSDEPSVSPSDAHSDTPSGDPSEMPSESPSGIPSALPSKLPSSNPSDEPSVSPSNAPSDEPSDEPSALPSRSPSDEPSVSPSVDPSDSPSDAPSALPSRLPSSNPSDEPSHSSDIPSTVPSDIPSSIASDEPSTTPSDTPSETPSETAIAAWTSLSRDLVEGSQLNGPHWETKHGWAWPGIHNGCSSYQNFGVGSYVWPCGVNNQFLDRVLNFDSSYMNFQFAFDQGMEATISLANAATPGAEAAQSISLIPSGASGSSACVGPPATNNWQTPPIRLARSGRYLHHWYSTGLNCNGASDDTRVEIKVTPDCVELHTISNNGEEDLKWLNAGDSTEISSSTNGYSVVSYCVQCESETSGSFSDDLSGCSIVQTQVPTECCPLSIAANDRTVSSGNLCGTGWAYGTCDASSLMTSALSSDVSVSTTPAHPINGEGHSFEIRLPQGGGNKGLTDQVTVVSINNSADKWKKVKLNFHMSQPVRITGVSGVLRDPITKEPTGIHVQMSKNWHVVAGREGVYDGYWWTGVAHIRVPPGETKLELVVAWQKYMDLHAVSHSQLSLIGWGVNGLWEEVGLGSNGESITYEPHGHHRRQMILDTRPWLACKMGTESCVGDPDDTHWTENHGGGDFLNAVNNNGLYQYLVRDTTYHTMNGPRLTNATYAGVTQDQNIQVSRTVSTWTADDFVRHLHSFNYRFLAETAGDQYPRFALYTLGGDNYNYVQFPYFAYGMGDQNSLPSAVDVMTEIVNTTGDMSYTDYFQTEAPAGCGLGDNGSCWFAMLTDPGWNIHMRGNRGIIVRNFHGRLNGQEWPPAGDTTVSPFTFSLVRSRILHNGAKGNTVSIEIGLPKKFLEDVNNAQAKFLEGDYISADIELLVPPRQNGDSISNSVRLETWLENANVDTDFTQGWKIIANEASGGDSIVTSVFTGSLERKYHPRIQVDSSDEARFNIEIPNDMPGILPITIAGVESTAGFRTGLLERPDRKLWRYVAGAWKEFGINGDYQLEKDVLDNSYTYVYSLRMEFEPDAVTNCEQFAFAQTAPTDTNPACN